jgi:transcriptional regulator GlxA family with amidase domain
MQLPARFRTPLFALLLVLAGAVASAGLATAGDSGDKASAGAQAKEEAWVCTPCGAACDDVVHKGPGICPHCGMPLVRATASAQPRPPRKKVAILIFDAVQIIDYAGPYEMFGAAGLEVFTVAASPAAITTSMGMTVVPAYTFANAPQPDVLVIPGGGVHAASKSEPTLDYLKRTNAHTSFTLTVCNGAFILANTGLLEGLAATTTRTNLEDLAREFPKIKVVGDQRYVDNGHIITAGGLSAGIDGALHVLEKLLGEDAALQVAKGEEYNWQRGTALPAALQAAKPTAAPEGKR